MNFREWFLREAIDLGYFNNRQVMSKLVDQAIKYWMDWSGSDGDGFRDEAKLKLYGDLYPDEENEDEIDKTAKALAKQELTANLQDLLWMYERFGDPLRLYRMITVQGRSKKQLIQNIHLIHLGEFWAHKENAAEAHWGRFNSGFVKVMLYAEVPSHSVNWEHTLIKNMMPSYSAEKEVEVHRGSPIHVTAIQIDGRKWEKVNLTGFA